MGIPYFFNGKMFQVDSFDKKANFYVGEVQSTTNEKNYHIGTLGMVNFVFFLLIPETGSENSGQIWAQTSKGAKFQFAYLFQRTFLSLHHSRKGEREQGRLLMPSPNPATLTPCTAHPMCNNSSLP
jgi:hypothetical protein